MFAQIMFALYTSLLLINNNCLFTVHLLALFLDSGLCLFVCLQAEVNSPEQFVGIILREKISGSFIDDVYRIYRGEVVPLCFQELEFLSLCLMLTLMDFG